MTNTLKISPDVALPLDVAGEAIGILATRGAGKSYTSAGLIEELYKAGIQTVVIDPAGVYWGLRSSAKGTGEGLPIIVLGGVHGDVPLEATAGKATVERAKQDDPQALRVVRNSATRRPPAPRAATAQPSEGVSRSQQKILAARAMLEDVGITQPTRTQLALWAEVSPTSGGYFNNLGSLRTGGLIDYPSGGTVALTDAGRARAPAPEPLTAEQMQDSLCAKVGNSKAAILRALIGIYPKQIGRDELAEKIGVSATSGGYFNNLGALRTLGVIDYPSPGHVVALPVLFLE